MKLPYLSSSARLSADENGGPVVPNFSTIEYINENHHSIRQEHRMAMRKLLLFFVIQFLLLKNGNSNSFYFKKFRENSTSSYTQSTSNIVWHINPQ